MYGMLVCSNLVILKDMLVEWEFSSFLVYIINLSFLFLDWIPAGIVAETVSLYYSSSLYSTCTK